MAFENTSIQKINHKLQTCKVMQNKLKRKNLHQFGRISMRSHTSNLHEESIIKFQSQAKDTCL